MTLRRRELHQAQQAARRHQEAAEWKAEYAVRAGVEGTLSQGVRGFGPRRCRYIGPAEARLRHVATAAAIDVYRTSGRPGGVPRAATRTPPFVHLAARTEFADGIRRHSRPPIG